MTTPENARRNRKGYWRRMLRKKDRDKMTVANPEPVLVEQDEVVVERMPFWPPHLLTWQWYKDQWAKIVGGCCCCLLPALLLLGLLCGGSVWGVPRLVALIPVAPVQPTPAPGVYIVPTAAPTVIPAALPTQAAPVINTWTDCRVVLAALGSDGVSVNTVKEGNFVACQVHINTMRQVLLPAGTMSDVDRGGIQIWVSTGTSTVEAMDLTIRQWNGDIAEACSHVNGYNATHADNPSSPGNFKCP